MTTAPTQPTTDFPAEAAISNDRIDSLRAEFDSNARWGLSQNAITQVGIDDVALNRSVVTSTDYTFSTLLDDWKVTNQRQSGRCWMFAALNLFRVGAMKAMNLKNFEFSQNYTLFWDKFERANYFLSQILDTADRPLDDRTVDDRALEDRRLDDRLDDRRLRVGLDGASPRRCRAGCYCLPGPS